MKAWKLFVAALAVAAIWGLADLAKAEALINFEPIKSGARTLDSFALNVDPSVMLSQLNGGLFFKEGSGSYAVPVWGSCMQSKGLYVCGITNGAYTFELRMDTNTRKGTVYPISGPFDSMEPRKAEWTDNAPRLLPR